MSADKQWERWLNEQRTQGRLSKVRPNPGYQRELMAQARRDLTSAKSLIEDNPSLAIAASHDAARRAIWAIVNKDGHRVIGGGEHQTTVAYAAHRPQLLDAATGRRLDDLRRLRHDVEYGAVNELPQPAHGDALVAHQLATGVVARASKIVAPSKKIPPPPAAPEPRRRDLGDDPGLDL